MTPEAAKHIAEGIAWFGFWIAIAAVAVAAIFKGWKPWESSND